MKLPSLARAMPPTMLGLNWCARVLVSWLSYAILAALRQIPGVAQAV